MISNGYVGWKLPEAERARLLGIIVPRYDRIVAHHVTLAFGVDETYPMPMKIPATIIGAADDCNGVQCAIVEMGGTCDRPDGSIFHITWSLGVGRKPVESNHVAQLWRRMDGTLDFEHQTIFYTPEPIILDPFFTPF